MNIRLRQIHSYILVILILFNNSLMWRCLIDIPNFLYKSLFLLWCMVGCLDEKKIVLDKRWISVVVGIILYVSVYILLSNYNQVECFTDFLITFIIIGTYFYTLIRQHKIKFFLEAFVNIITVLGFVSLVFWLFGSVLNIIPGGKIITYFWGGEVLSSKNYFYLYFENMIQNQSLFGLNLPRNCGMFVEVPGYSGMLLYAIGIEWFCKEKVDKKQFIILLLTLLSTQSLKAYISLIVVFVVKFLIDNRKTKSIGIILLKFLFSCLLAVIGISVIFEMLESKSSSASYIVRMDDLNAAMLTWKDNKIFGSGYGNDLSIINNTSTPWLRNNDALSMGLGVLLAEGGVYLTFFYFLSFLLGYKNIRNTKHKVPYLMFSLLVLLNITISNDVFTVNMLSIISLGYANYAYTNSLKI